ncbi:MAG: hypothetical protein E7644_03165 [Ruminococcaceae bacterium]|nr:hypothetical protein [Oscillospiraceae bacterium]
MGWRRYFPLLLVGALFLLLLLRADVAMEGARRGITLTMGTLLPSLFPFLVLSDLLVTLGAGEMLGRWLKKPLRRLFGVSGGGAAAFLLGTLCGFPTGAATAVALRKKGVVSGKELERLFLFVNNPSPGFLISVVGGAMLGNAAAGAALFAATTLSSVLIGITLRLLAGPVPEETSASAAPLLSPGDVGASVKRGFFTMLQVAALVIFFSAVTATLTSVLQAAAVPRALEVLLIGLLELTSGISAAVTALSPESAFLLAAFFAGFSGFSVCMQVLAVAEGEGLRPWPYLLAKTVQGVLSLGLASAYLKLCRPHLCPSESVFLPTGLQANTPRCIFLLGLFFLLLSVMALLLKKPKK